MPEAVFEIDINFNLTYVNQKAIELFGYSHNEVTAGLNSMELIVPEQRELALNNFTKRLKGEEPGTLEYRAIKKDGSTFPILFHASSIVEDSKLLGARGVILDISQQKRAEQEIRNSAEKFKNIFNNSVVGKSITFLDGSIQVNKAFSEIIGYSEEELNQMKWQEFTHTDDVDSNQEIIDSIVSGEINTARWEKRYIHKKGHIVWVDISSTLQKDEKNNPQFFITSIVDITKRKKTEKNLIKAKEKAEATEVQLLTILENSPTGFAINKISTGKVTYVNKTFTEIYHIPIELCHSVTSFFEYVYGDKMELGNRITEDIQSNDPERMKWEMVPVTDKTTKKVHFVSAANIILKNLDLMISSVWDITPQVENEEKLIAALNKATESDRLKSAFLTNMSHEIRTPMNGILGFADLLKEPNLTGEQQQKYIAIIEKSGERMLNTINDIIDISKIEAGLIDVHISELDISDQFKNLYSFFKPEADKKGIQLLVKNQLAGDDAIIFSDKNKLNSILINLLKNALKFCDKGTIELGCFLKGKTLELYVKDTGKGIPDERQQAVFDRFIQADIEDKDAKQGSGLGLTISKSYVEILGGEIWVESKPGKGSIFYFTIPYNPGKTQKNEVRHFKSVDELKKELIQLKILLVEDDPVSEMLTKIMVNKLSKEIKTVTNGIDAVRICKDNPDINLILMDIRIPGMNGYEATRKIRQFNKEIIIIAQTAFALSGDREKALKAGCNDYIPKPLNRLTLLNMIDKHLRPQNV